jgi:signal transduction histidine kinase
MRRTRGEQRAPARFAVVLWLAASVFLCLLVFLVASLLSEGRSAAALVALICAAAAAALSLLIWGFLRAAPSFRTLEERAAQLQRFCSAIKKAASTLELQSILDASAEVVAEVTGVRGCTISIVDTATGRMTVRASIGDTSGDTVERFASRESLLKGEPLVVRDTLARDFPEVDDEAESLVCVPLRLEERVLGAICVYGAPGQRLSSEMISILSSLGEVVSLAIAHAFAFERLQEVSQTNTRFMLTASHELRSPADAISSIARTLLEGFVGTLNDHQRDLLARIDHRARILADTVSDLLALGKGRLDQATYTPTAVDLGRLVRESIRLFEERAAAKGLRLAAGGDLREARVSGSEEMLRSVVTNLVANAVSYTPAGGSVELRVSRNDGLVILEVSDTGIGIPAAEQGRLFEEFFRASNAKQTVAAGTGLGLAIVKENVERCGGTISVVSEEGRGTTFRVMLKPHP